MQTWPFMLTANRWLDYRIVLLPQFVKNSSQTNALMAIADRCLQNDSGANDPVLIDSPELGKLAVWYEKKVAQVDGRDLIDRAGRQILRVQGIIFRNYPKEFESRQ